MDQKVKCLRCGYCCTMLAAVIVVDPTKRRDREDNLRYINLLEERCPHLRGDKPGEYSCAIHHYRWFKTTPCGRHQQLYGRVCRMGTFILSKGSAK